MWVWAAVRMYAQFQIFFDKVLHNSKKRPIFAAARHERAIQNYIAKYSKTLKIQFIMATAINFNWVITEKVTEGKVYNFEFVDMDGNCTDLEFSKESDRVKIQIAGEETARYINIFRAGMRVIDSISLAITKAGRVTSGAVYKADILTAINSDYEEREMYTGIHNPSHNFEANMPYKDSPYYLGFELETAGRNDDCETALHRLRSNIWRQVTDASINGRNGAEGIEFVTTLLHPDDAVKPAFYESFFDMLTGLAVSSSLPSTGLHCHISRTAFGDTEEEQNENIAKLVYMENYILNENRLAELYGRGRGDWCRTNQSSTGILTHVAALQSYEPRILNAQGIREALTADLLEGNKARSGHNYPHERYRAINITNQNTVEFRQGKGQIKSQVLANIAQHACTIAKYCRETAWHKLSAQGYYQSIPTSAKYGEIKRIFNPSTDE